MKVPVEFRFRDMLPFRPAEAAARRRIRTLVTQHPDVQSWGVSVWPQDEQPGADGYTAEVEARTGRACMVRVQARGTDPLAALRLAFNAAEQRLDDQQERARSRLAQWIAALRSRVPPREGSLA